MAELRVVFLVFHIIFAGFVIAQVPVAIYFKRAIRNAAGQPSELGLMATMGQMMGGLGGGGGIGLLVTGLALLGLDRLGLLGLFGPTPLWLMLKQIIYIIILVIIMAVLTPMAKRSAATLMAAGRSGQPMTDALREEFFKTERISMLVNLLVFINIVLGVWKPQ